MWPAHYLGDIVPGVYVVLANMCIIYSIGDITSHANSLQVIMCDMHIMLAMLLVMRIFMQYYAIVILYE